MHDVLIILNFIATEKQNGFLPRMASGPKEGFITITKIYVLLLQKAPYLGQTPFINY